MALYFEIANENFYLDLDRISDFIKIDSVDTLDDILSGVDDLSEEELESLAPQGQMVDVTKWEMTKTLIEVLLQENGIVDEGMGITKLGEQLSIPFRISFNTLIHNKIIKVKDD
jgi:hypothetical protein